MADLLTILFRLVGGLTLEVVVITFIFKIETVKVRTTARLGLIGKSVESES